MILRITSLLTAVFYFFILLVSVKVSHVIKYYGNFAATLLMDNRAPEYDFVIVGSGSAGSVLANRLSKHNTVLLIEAGGTPFYANQVPFMLNLLLGTPEVDYMYKTVPQQTSCQGLTGKAAFLHRGKLIGGSSNINNMVYFRGHPADYDNWANLTDDDSWRYANIKNYFDRSVEYSRDLSTAYKLSLRNGVQNIEKLQISPLNKMVMKAGQELGFEVDIDFNAYQRPGLGPIDTYMRLGTRVSSYSDFIEPILGRENLYISKYSQAIRIELSKYQYACGVWYMQHGSIKYAAARKEIVVSAGAIDSPKLLMLSGVGPEEHLKEIEIKPLVKLPVGQNLQDHLLTVLLPFSFNGPPHYLVENDLGVFDLVDYYLNGSGFLTLSIGSFSQVVFSSGVLRNKNESNVWSDLLMYIVHGNTGPTLAVEMSRSTNIRRSILETLFSRSGTGNEDVFYILLALGRPKSSGFIKLKSKDVSQEPDIDPMYLSEMDDLYRIVDGVKFAFELVERTKAFQEVNATYANIPIQECGSHKFKSDRYWQCYVKHISVSMYHPVGTCRMGRGTHDKHAVVDSKLRVLHTNGLRVADASIMPYITNGNTNAPTVMIAEKAADMIREHWAQHYLVCMKFEMIMRYTDMCFYSAFV